MPFCWKQRVSLTLFFLSHLFGLTVAFTYSFPDCVNGPLSTNLVCNTSASVTDRAKAVVSLFTTQELISNTVNQSPGVSRLGLPAYQWWSEALHGVASSPGVTFAASGNWSHATSFPQPITIGAAFDDDLVESIATVVSTEARSFNNAGRAGLDFFTPNINPFKDPRWGRGQETPGEDPFHVASYVFRLISGLQGGVNPEPFLKVAADCKHFAAYDLENGGGTTRFAFNAIVSQQDLVEYYLPSFQSCIRDAKVASVMCSYNAVNGVPSCANEFLLQTVLRDLWGFTDNNQWVTSDCDAIGNIWTDHHYVTTATQAAAVALNAGTDIDCGTTYSSNLGAALNQSLITQDALVLALVRQYSSLVRLGYFDPISAQPFRQLGWDSVNTPASQTLAYTAAVEGIVLLTNDGTLPFKPSVKNIAFIGPWASATTQMQGNYQGVAPFLVSPVAAATAAGLNATFALGTAINGNSQSGFGAAIATATSADAIVFLGGIDDSIEAESKDRATIVWPGNQLDLISRLAALEKPFVVLQMGGGQVDSSSLKNNSGVNAILWGGYPGQSGGTAIIDILLGHVSPAGRLPVTQYPAGYVNQVAMTDMTLRASQTNPGRTYKWYSGTPVFEFGHGLHYTQFRFSWASITGRVFDIQQLVSQANASGTQFIDSMAFTSFAVSVENVGSVKSDYVALLFLNSTDGPQPAPIKQLVSYTRVLSITPGNSLTANLPLTLGAISRVDENGNTIIFPGTYTLTLDVANGIADTFTLTGEQVQLVEWPQS